MPPFPAPPAGGPQDTTANDDVLTALAASAGTFEAFLWNLDDAGATSAREFLASRSISEATARRFHVGYAPNMAGGRADVPALVDAGLMDRYGHSRFNDRLMFPVIDAAYETVGFIGRSLNDDRPPRYLRTRPFRDVPYGLHAACDKADAAGGVMVITNGVMDVLALHEAGIEHAVGCFGTSLTPRQAKRLSAYCRSVTFWTELDAAGSDWLNKACQVARDADLDTFGACNVFGNTAANALVTSGPEAMRLQLASELERQRITAAESLSAATDLHVSLVTGGGRVLDFLAACVAHPSVGVGLLRRALDQRADDLFPDRCVRRAAELLRDNIEDPHAALLKDEPEASVIVFEVIKFAARCDLPLAELLRMAIDLGVAEPVEQSALNFVDVKAWEFLGACVKYPRAGGERFLKTVFAAGVERRYFPDPGTRKAACHLAEHLPQPVVRPAEMTNENMHLWDLSSRVSLMGEAAMYLGLYDSPEALLQATWETVEHAVTGLQGMGLSVGA